MLSLGLDYTIILLTLVEGIAAEKDIKPLTYLTTQSDRAVVLNTICSLLNTVCFLLYLPLPTSYDRPIRRVGRDSPMVVDVGIYDTVILMNRTLLTVDSQSGS